MTDKEIIKAFEACLNRLNRCVCTIDDCPYADNNECSIDLWKDAFDLLNRQQAEIERLEVFAKIATQRSNDYRVMRNKVKTARAEATKEFAERLKVEIVRCKDCKHYIVGFCTRDINGRTNMFRMSENDFCNYGERQAEE